MKELDIASRYSDFDSQRQVLINEADEYAAVSERFEQLPGITKGVVNILRRWGLDLSGRDKQNQLLQKAAQEFEKSTGGVELACYVLKKSFDLESVSYYAGSPNINFSFGHAGGSGGHFNVDVSTMVNDEKFYNSLSGQYIDIRSYGDEQGRTVHRIPLKHRDSRQFEIYIPRDDELKVKRYRRGHYDGKVSEVFPDYTVLPWSSISPARFMGDPNFQGSVEEKRQTSLRR